jgi:hypothetical protein
MAITEIRAAWLAQLLSTEPADRPRAESAVQRLYAAAGFAKPRHFLWFESPFEASWAVALLVAPYHQIWRDRFSSRGASREDRERADNARATLSTRLGIADWNQMQATVGRPRGGSLMWPPDPSVMFTTKLLQAWYSIVDDISALFKVHGDDDDLARAESHFWGSNKGALRSALHCPTTDILIGQSFFEDYSFSRMADNEHQLGDRRAPPVMQAAWDIARSSGMWWPFENVAILSERPAEVRVNDKYLLHRGDGPAVVFRDGLAAYAWNGKAVPERWIMQPETVPPREYKGFDPTFGKYVASRVGSPSEKTKKRAKPGSILKAALPTDPVARLEHLRAHAGGRLPLFDRYKAGEHKQVWAELGAAAREDPTAADALAVAYETMRRVEANVRTLVQRLIAMKYAFTSEPRRAPDSSVRKAIADFEKDAGSLPLSLRVFYEVVGEVNFIGTHPAIDPKGNSIAIDPLVVYGFDEGLAECDDEDDAPSAITIAPDDLHKANVSGGDPYEMAIPDLRADGELLNERHNLFFVDYLRLCFRFGGFPGYEGRADVPAELATLSAGLIAF